MGVHRLINELQQSSLAPSTKAFLSKAETVLRTADSDPTSYTTRINELVSELGTALRDEMRALDSRVTAPNAAATDEDLEKLDKVLVVFARQLGKVPKDVRWNRDQLIKPKDPDRAGLREFLGRRKVSAQSMPPSTDKSDDARMTRSLSKMREARHLGLGGKTQIGKGKTGTAWLEKATGKIGVYKPGWMQTPLIAAIQNLIKMLTVGQLRFLPRGLSAQPQAEAASYEFDRAFGIGSVPPTRMLEDGAAYQMSVQKHLKAKHKLSTSNDLRIGTNLHEGKDAKMLLNKKSYDSGELDVWQPFCLGDFGVGNLDCHDENYFIYHKDGIILDVAGIDKANSHVVRDVPVGVVADKNRYAWRHEGISHQPFGIKSIRIMEDMAYNWRSKINYIVQQRPELKEFYSPEMMQLMDLRMQVLRKAAKLARNSDVQFTPAQLGEIRDADQMRRFLSGDYMPMRLPMPMTT